MRSVGPDDYQVAVPTYRRVVCLASRTLPLLHRGGVDPQRITLVCADTDDAASYRKHIDPGLYGRISIASPTLRAARHHIAALYPVGTPVVQADDDIAEVLQALDAKTLAPVPSLHALFVDAFTRSQEAGAYLWGVAPVPNAFYLAPGKVSTGLKFCIGTLFGWWSRGAHHPSQVLHLDEKEDYERTLRFFDADGLVLRYDGIALKTRHYDEPGGMQEYRQVADSHVAAEYLMAHWPHLVSLNHRRVGPRAEIVLRKRKVAV